MAYVMPYKLRVIKIIKEIVISSKMFPNQVIQFNNSVYHPKLHVKKNDIKNKIAY